MLRQPILIFIFSLSADECRAVVVLMLDGDTHCIQALDVFDVIINTKLQTIRPFIGHDATSAWARHQGHCGTTMTKTSLK